ncbi:MADS-box transcription factor, putative [Ricinus communis]|uniref:MADS-box transcription factor, putative n=1 Tax=Ricinus communis TaxID=3988 RepID=B9RAD7_RICCO|nr:MADS-box transcription factor, putative [Ricinus communis]
MDRTIARYRSEVGLLGSTDLRTRSLEYWRNEIEELKRTIDTMETRLKHFSGEDISVLGMKELKQLERHLKVGVERIRSKKHKVLQEENNRLQKRLHELQDANISSGILQSNARNAFDQQKI